MAEATQFCIGMENQPGKLADLCAALRRAEVNIDALFISHEEDCCWANLVASPPAEAGRVLADAGYNYYTEKVLMLHIDNRPGQLERVSEQLAEDGININYVYGSCSGNICTLVFNVTDLAAAEKSVGDKTPTNREAG